MTNRTRRPRFDRAWRKAISALLVSLLSLPVCGQVTQTGGLTVIVTDSERVAVSSATITLTNVDTNQTFERVTDDEGRAVFTELPVGRYKVTVGATGFAKMDVPEPVMINIARSASLVIVVEPDGVRFTRFMVSDAVERELPDLMDQLSAIPNQNNDLSTLLQIVPGAVATGPSSLGRIIVDGRGLDQQTARLDGVDFTPQVDFPSVDSAINPISSFQKPEVAGDLDSFVPRSGAFGFEPRHGPGTGVVTEGATYNAINKSFIWVAQFYGEHRNDALNARNFFDSDGENALRRTRFGGKAGGPLFGSKRAFLFLAYDGLRGRIERNVYEAVPIEAATGIATGPLAPHLRAFLPQGTHLLAPSASLDANFLVARRRTRATAESNAWDVRLDYFAFRPSAGGECPNHARPKECSPLTFRFTHQTAENQVPDGVTGRSQRQRFFFVNALVGWRLMTHTKPVRNELERKRSTKDFGHNFRLGFNLMRAHMDTETIAPTSSDLAQSLITIGGTVPVTGLPLPPALPQQPRSIPIATLGGLIRGTGRGLDLKPTSYSAIYDFSRPFKEAKRHELYAGFEARFLRLDFNRLGGLTYAFPNIAALRAGTPGSVTFQSDLSGTSPFSTGVGRRSARQQYYMGYVQMVSQFPRPCERKPGEKPPLVIRVPQPGQQPVEKPPCNENLEPALTLTYGLRYDYFSRVRENDARAVIIDPLTGQILQQGAPFYRVDKVNFQPRFGLAYRPANEGTFKNTMIRAGVGLYSGVPRISDLTLPIESDRFSTGVTGGTFPANPADVVRGFVENPLTRQFQPLAFARDYSPLERALKWDVRVGHLHSGYEFSAYYVGNVGRNLALANITNRIERVVTNPDPSRPAIVVRQFDVVRDGLVFQPFGEFFYRMGGGRSSYNALSLQISRDSKDELPTPRQWLKLPVKNFNAKYTLSRSVGNASGTILSNPLDPNADFGHNLGIPRHSFTLSAVYDLWRAPEVERNLNNLLWGWKLMPVLKATSGLPLIIRVNRPDVVYVDAASNVHAAPAAGRTAVLNTPGGGSSGGAFTPNLIPGVNPLARNGIEVLNPAAFAIPAPGEVGKVRRGQFRGPIVVQFDLGLRRNFPLPNKEKMRGEFQVEIFNLFNRANFINPTAVLPGLLGTNVAENQLQPGVPFTRTAAGNFGVVTAADPGRLIQVSFTVRFNQGFTK